MTDFLDLCRLKGTDPQFLDFIRRQPSCLTGNWSEWLGDIGEWRNPACHVRRAATFGTAFKADFSAVPMTQTEHLLQSNRGEAAVLNRYLTFKGWTNQLAKEFFDKQVIRYRKLWLMT